MVSFQMLYLYNKIVCRRALPEELPVYGEDDPKAVVPRVRTHLPPALPRGGAARRGGAPQHLL